MRTRINNELGKNLLEKYNKMNENAANTYFELENDGFEAYSKQ